MRNKIILGECIKEMSKLPNDSVDMILCDLPYGTTNCSWDVNIPFDSLWHQYNRLIKQNGAIVLTACQPFTSLLVSSNIKNFKYSMVWEKSKATGFLNSKIRPLVAHEDILIFCNGKPPYHPQMKQGESYDKGVRKIQTSDDIYGKFNSTHVKSDGLRYPRTVIYFKTAESEGKVMHKTQKPIALFEYLINTYSSHGDLVLDNCAGSGTTGISCLNTGRDYLLIEKDESYFNIMSERISKHKKVRLS